MDYTEYNTMTTYEHIQSQSRYINGPFYAHAFETVRTPSVTRAHGKPGKDIKSLIHCMETEAYGSVLRALIAQSDLLSWGKEGLITELRKELNVTDIEHGELLVKINSDESIKMIREWRKATSSAEQPLHTQMNASGIASALPGDTSQKRLKASHAAAPKSLQYALHGQPSSATISSHFPAQFRDEQQTDQVALVPAVKSMKVVWHNSQAPSINKGGGPQKSQSVKGCHVPDTGNVKKTSDVIEIRATDKLIQEVERVICGRENPDPDQVEKAKLLLEEHETAILEALAKLADVLDGDQARHHYSYNKLPGTGRGMASYNDSNGRPCLLNAGYDQGFVKTHSNRRRVRFIDMTEEEMTLDDAY